MNVNSVSVFMMGAGLLCLGLSAYVWRHRHDHTALSLSLLLLAAAIWSFFYGVEFSHSSLAPMRVALVLQYLGIASMPVLFFVFAVRYSGNDGWLCASRVAFLCILPVFTVVMNATNDSHHLFYTSVSVGVASDFSFLRLQPGPLYWLNIVYSHVLFVAGLVFMIRMFFRVSRVDRPRVGYLLVSALLAFGLNVAYRVGLRPYGFLDLTPVGFAVMGVMLTEGILTRRIFDIKPVALDVLFDGIPDAVLVLDTNGRVVNANPAARVLLESTVVRQQLDATAGRTAGAAAGADPPGAEGAEIDAGGRFFSRMDTELFGRGGSRLGTLIVLRDVTERRRVAERLQRSRDRYRSLVNNIPGATYQRARDAHRTMRFMSAGIETLSGYAPDDFLDGGSRTWESVVHLEDLERVERAIGAAVEQQSPWEVEYRILHRDGAVRWVYEKGVATLDPDTGETSLNGFILDITQQKRDRAEVDQSHRELRRLATHLQAVREQERAAVAWELHDEIGQALSVVRMDVADCSGRLSGEEHLKMRARLRRAVEVLDGAIARLRRVYTGLRPGMLDDLGLAATIDWQTSEFARASGIDCRVGRLEEVQLSDDRSSLAVFRVFQGVLNTVVRNSGATSADVSVEQRGRDVVVSISDNGRAVAGGDAPPYLSLEYAAMRERMHERGGTLTMRTGNAGQRVTEISVPLRQPEASVS